MKCDDDTVCNSIFNDNCIIGLRVQLSCMAVVVVRSWYDEMFLCSPINAARRESCSPFARLHN